MFKNLLNNQPQSEYVSELEATTAGLQRKLLKYEKKLKDLVVAYRSVCEERDALLEVINSSSVNKAQKSTEQDEKSVVCEILNEEAPSPNGAEGGENKSPDIEDTLSTSESSVQASNENERLKKLTSAFNLLSKEKSRLEEAYVKDKKALREECDRHVNEISGRLKDMNCLNEKLELQIKELRSKVREQQISIDDQNETSSIMLKELQNLLAEERQRVTKQHARISDLEASLANERALKADALKYQSKVTSLEKELEDVSIRLQSSESKSNETPQMLAELQREIQEIRASNKVALIAEQKRARDAEMRALYVEQSSEERICNLESKLSEFTETLAHYESGRVESLNSINLLKERVAQLDLENALLSQAVGKEKEDSNLSVEAIEGELLRYKELYKVARTKAGLSVFEDSEPNNEDRLVSHEKCAMELNQLKDEFDRYKTRAQNLLRNKVRDGENAEIERLRSVIKSLREEINELLSKNSKLEDEISSVQSKHGIQLKVMKKDHSSELERRENAHKCALKEMEDALIKQRQRMSDLIMEKEKELKDAHYQSPYSLEKIAKSNLTASQESLDTVFGESNSESGAAMSPSRFSGVSMHTRETLARKEAELNQMRKERIDAQNALKALQEEAMMREIRLQEQIESLSNQVSVFKTREAREGSNIEYVKNVMHRFLLCSSASDARNSMLDALLTALHFTPAEQSAVKKAQGISPGSSTKWFS